MLSTGLAGKKSRQKIDEIHVARVTLPVDAICAAEEKVPRRRPPDLGV
jgi:hypothetical protein